MVASVASVPESGGLVTGNTPLLPTPDSQHGRKDSRTSPLLPGAIEDLTTSTSTGRESSSKLLPTPAANDSHNSPENHLRKKPGRSQVTSLQIIAENGLIETGGLLPTPSVSDGTGGHLSRSGARRSEKLLGGLAKDLTPLMPTPTAGDAKSARNSTANRISIPPTGVHSGNTLTDEVSLLPTPRSGHGMNDSMDSARERLENGARSRLDFGGSDGDDADAEFEGLEGLALESLVRSGELAEDGPGRGADTPAARRSRPATGSGAAVLTSDSAPDRLGRHDDMLGGQSVPESTGHPGVSDLPESGEPPFKTGGSTPRL